MRSIWSGAISFGLVNIPIRLYSATGSEDLDFDMLDKKNLSPIRYARISLADGKEVEYKDIVKGYEYEKGSYIVLTDKDFEKASPEKTKTIDITDFVKEEEIDSVYFEKSYYLEPDKGAAKAYILLREALLQSNKVGIAEYMIRNRVRLGALKVSGNLIILNQLRYHSEIRDASALKVPDQNVSDKEIDMAVKLIAQLTKKFKPENYKDNYIEELKKIIEAKAQGKEIRVSAHAEQPTKVKDLMSVLKESLKQAPAHGNGRKKVA